VRELGTSVEAVDVVEFGGRIVAPALEPAYIVMNKPLGVVTTMRDPEGRRTIADVLQGHALERRVVPVGRLDYDTAGVLLLTDDGGLAHVLTHPRFGVEKTYRAMLRGRLTMEQIAALQRGMKLDERRCHDPRRPQPPSPAHVRRARSSGHRVDATALWANRFGNAGPGRDSLRKRARSVGAARHRRRGRRSERR
jgi:16S rRNA U516 pseudouridylate synthase RsuA-like enzyme